jgi:hypothetical protein
MKTAALAVLPTVSRAHASLTSIWAGCRHEASGIISSKNAKSIRVMLISPLSFSSVRLTPLSTISRQERQEIDADLLCGY